MKDIDLLNLPHNHYFKLAREVRSVYYDEFTTAISSLSKVITANELEIVLNDKILLNKTKFDEKQFIQGACEVAVANYFSTKDNFKMEVKVNPLNHKNVDCQFTSNGFTYNIEVKCSTYQAVEEILKQTDSIFLQTFGRIKNRDHVFNALARLFNEGPVSQGNSPIKHSIIKNMDNNLKDYLLSANDKFSAECDENEINILLIGCDSPMDMQNYMRYLQFTEGLFTKESFIEHNNYDKVDIVVLTNLYFKHKDFHLKSVSNSWNLDRTLNLFVCNPFRRNEKKTGIRNFSNELVNYNSEINTFSEETKAPFREQFIIPHFVQEFLERDKGIFLFESPKKHNA